MVVGKHAFLHYKYLFFHASYFYSLSNLESLEFKSNHAANMIRQRARESEQNHETSGNIQLGTIKRMQCSECIENTPGAAIGTAVVLVLALVFYTAADDGAGSGDIGAGGVDIGVGAGGSAAGVGIGICIDVGVGICIGVGVGVGVSVGVDCVGAGHSPELAEGLVISPWSSSFCCVSCLSFSLSSCSFSEPSSSFSLLSFSSSRRRRCRFLL